MTYLSKVLMTGLRSVEVGSRRSTSEGQAAGGDVGRCVGRDEVADDEAEDDVDGEGDVGLGSRCGQRPSR